LQKGLKCFFHLLRYYQIKSGLWIQGAGLRFPPTIYTSVSVLPHLIAKIQQIKK
jgi:hypothetical protein